MFLVCDDDKTQKDILETFETNGPLFNKSIRETTPTRKSQPIDDLLLKDGHLLNQFIHDFKTHFFNFILNDVFLLKAPMDWDEKTKLKLPIKEENQKKISLINNESETSE